MAEQIPNLGALSSVKCNSNGNQVSILISQVSKQPTAVFPSCCCFLSSMWTLPLRLMDGLIKRSTFMTLRWTRWHTLTSSLVDHLVVSRSQKKANGKHRCVSVLCRNVSFSCCTLLFVSGSSLTRQITVVAAQCHNSGMRTNLDFSFVKQCQSALNPHRIASWKW